MQCNGGCKRDELTLKEFEEEDKNEKEKQKEILIYQNYESNEFIS